MKNIILLLITFLTFNCFAQFSKTHYIPPITHSNALTNNGQVSLLPQGQFMYISCPSIVPVNFKIFQIGNNTISGTVSRDTPYKLNIGTGSTTQLIINPTDISSIVSNKGFIVEAEDLVYVTVRLTATTQNFHAGGLVSKGLAALGNRFRVGAFVNINAPNTSTSHFTFATILATENNTLVEFADIKPGVILFNNAGVGNTPTSIVLNRGQSFAIATQGPSVPNKDGLIGALIKSDKPISVNCGSFAGSNGDTTNLDLGLDQLVSQERTGKEYIFIKGVGVDVVERPLIVADFKDPLNPLAGTDVFLNNSPTPFITLLSGQYLALDGSHFSTNGNLYVKTSKNVFAFQGIGGPGTQANQNMHFLPPLSCETPKIINNIPFINEVGNISDFFGTICLVTKAGATLNFMINGVNYTAATLPQTLNGPFPVIGNPDHVTYTVSGLTGNVSVFSTKQVYLSYYASSVNATYGGFYSGFIYKPELSINRISTIIENCIPNVKLSVSASSSFDSFKWYQNNVEITGATSNIFTPLVPGLYKVVATITECGTTLESDQIPVSSCPEDFDNDNTNNNTDIDFDNDGISNCSESFGNIAVDLTNSTLGSVAISNYSNAFTGIQTSVGTQPAAAFVGNSNGNFVTETTSGKGNAISQKVNFTNPISLLLDYPLTANATDLLNANGEFILEVAFNKTITLLNPTGQLLVDTNYDGIYESGITNFSSFQIRFRLNSATPLAAGTGDFKFFSNAINSITFTHKNLSDSSANKATFNLVATCVPNDTDNDGVSNQLDLDSDNDGITDNREFLGQNFAIISFVDANKNGMNDAYETLLNLDSDIDGVLNYIDLDSDNDGIFDLTESGSNGIDVNFNGILDGNPTAFGANGLLNSLETAVNSGILNYSIRNSDSDNLQNYIDLDSDDDNCFDVIEAGFTDSNSDGVLGDIPVTVNTNGAVTSNSNGYTPLPNQNYVVGAPIIINTQPADQTSCDLQNVNFTVATNAVSGYQWQVSTDGVNFSNISNSVVYAGATTNSLQISTANLAMNGFKYRVVLNKNGNSCGLTSAAASLNMLVRPVVSTVTIVQCDDDLDNITDFNLTQKNALISANSASETFTYYRNQAAANSANPIFLIPNSLIHNSTNGTVWARVVNNATNCFNVARVNLIVSQTQIPTGTFWSFSKCDDFIDAANNDYDGISTFDFSSITNAINAIIPNSATYSVSYYKNEADFLAETDLAGNSLAITNISTYRNVGYPDFQKIWIRVESTLDNSCYGSAYINLTVEKVPVANPILFPRVCDNFLSDAIVNYNFDTSNVQSTILNGQTGVSVAYFDGNNNPLPSPLPNPFLSVSQTVRVRVTNNSTLDPLGACFDETSIVFTVNAQPIATPIAFAPKCDEILDDDNNTASFDTSNVQTTLLAGQVYAVKYYSESGFLLSTPLPNPFVTTTQKIRVVVENPINLACNAEIFIQFIVNPLPDVKREDKIILCSGQNNVPVTIDAGLQSGLTSDFTYKWFKDGVEITPAATNYSITVSEVGNYSVLVTNITTTCERTRKVSVVYSEKAKIENIIVSDLTENNTVNISVKSGLLGEYEFSLNNPNGPFQDSGIFQNIPTGFHEVYVNDKKGCGSISKTISVLGAPKFFTPNGDGFNDFWKLDGANATFYKNSIVYIFDKFGKLLFEIPNGQNKGWDGNFNGIPMPADDYWFTLEVDKTRNIKGHFSLKR